MYPYKKEKKWCDSVTVVNFLAHVLWLLRACWKVRKYGTQWRALIGKEAILRRGLRSEVELFMIVKFGE